MNAQAPQKAGLPMEIGRPAPMFPTTIKEAMEMGEMACALLELKPEDHAKRLAGIILTGLEIGVGPMTAARGIYIIKGRPHLGANLQRAIVQASPVCKVFRVMSHQVTYKDPNRAPELAATAMGIRADNGEKHTVTVTYSQFEHLHYTSSGKEHAGWRDNPARMLVARATTRLCDEHFADVTYGMSAAITETDDSGNVVEIIPVEPDQAPTGASVELTEEQQREIEEAERQARERDAKAAEEAAAADAKPAGDAAAGQPQQNDPPWGLDGERK